MDPACMPGSGTLWQVAVLVLVLAGWGVAGYGARLWWRHRHEDRQHPRMRRGLR